MTLEQFLGENGKWEEYKLNQKDLSIIEEIKQSRYDLWDWNYGKSPDYNVLKERRIEGFGKIEIYLQVEKGIIISASMRGDFFASRELENLCDLLIGHRLEYNLSLIHI